MRAMPLRYILIAALTCMIAAPSFAADDCGSRATLAGWASLPADSFREGPPSGEFDDAGAKRAQPRFGSQPVQGVSSIKPAAQGWWALSDNGFATKWNSPDYRLAIYRFDVTPRRSARDIPLVELRQTVELRDPARRFPYRITHEDSAERILTGADLDPESLVVMGDGSFWIGDEFGPWLLHFSSTGELLAPPVELPDELRSPQHPRVLAGKATATVPASRGIEGLALTAEGTTLLAALESPLASDATPERFVRLYRFDIASGQFKGDAVAYPLSESATSLGEITHFANDHYLALERDDGAGSAAKWKRVFTFRLQDGAVERRCVVDLLDITETNNLSGYGPRFALPYFTLEAVQALDARTLLVVNDNNYPATGARGTEVTDFTEWAWIRLSRPITTRAQQ
jgi:hypothetical protein